MGSVWEIAPTVLPPTLTNIKILYTFLLILIRICFNIAAESQFKRVILVAKIIVIAETAGLADLGRGPVSSLWVRRLCLFFFFFCQWFLVLHCF